jgi:5-amino-6-(5-phosphoribosylamino)uracil reductase
MEPRFRRLLPEPGEIDAGGLLASLRTELPASTDRPYTIANFVVSADGRAAFRGRSGPLGDDGDRALFHALREQADAVLAGTGTLRTERYGRLIRDAERRARRTAAGLEAEPLAAVISRSGTRIPLEIPLFAEPAARILLFSPTEPELAGVRAGVQFARTDPARAHPLRDVLRALRLEHDVRLLLCEGGPTLFAALLRERLLDDLFLTIVPKLAGGDSGPALTGAGPPLSELAQLRIVWLLARRDSLYVRYGLLQT